MQYYSKNSVAVAEDSAICRFSTQHLHISFREKAFDLSHSPPTRISVGESYAKNGKLGDTRQHVIQPCSKFAIIPAMKTTMHAKHIN